MIDTATIITEFTDAIRSAGFTPPPEIIPDGVLHRFSPTGEPDDDAGWYVLHLDAVPAGSFGSWKTGTKTNWSSRAPQSMTQEELKQAREHQRAAKQAAEAERKQLASEVAKKAQSMWASAPPAGDNHPYLISKQVQSFGLRTYKESLLIPLSESGAIITLQLVFPDGKKRFLKHSFTTGGAFIIGSVANAPTVVVGEGYATMASIHEATGLPCVVAFNADNLVVVGEKLREKLPDADIIIAADDDYLTTEPIENPGVTKATFLARKIGARLAVPAFGDDRGDKDTDFNDLAVAIGSETVAEQILAASEPFPIHNSTEGQTDDDRHRTSSSDIAMYESQETEIDTPPEDLFTRNVLFDAESFVNTPTHGVGADIVKKHYNGSVIFENFDNQGRGQFHRKRTERCYYEIVYNIHDQVRRILEHYVESYREQQLPLNENANALYKKVGQALQKCRTRNFLHGVVQLFAEMVTVPNIQWNTTPEVLPTATDLIDFTGDRPIKRQPNEGEYYRDPLPFDADDVFKTGDTPAFSRFLEAVFPDSKTRKTALQIASLAIANKPRKYFVVLQNAEGNGAKNSFIDVLSQVVPNRFGNIIGSAVTTNGDKSERRFGVAEGESKTAWIFDEISGSFDVPAIKRYTSLSSIRVERKGRDPKEIKPTWLLIAMANDFPSFSPPDDQAFLSRLLVVPFRSVFYSDDDARDRYIKMGVEEHRLKPARDKQEILNETFGERPAILARLIAEYITLRSTTGGIPELSPECIAAKERYRTTNDYIEGFFNDSLQRLNGARMTYPRVRELFGEYMGDSQAKMSTRKLVDELTRRYRFIERSKSNGERVLVNLSEKYDTESPTFDAFGSGGPEDVEGNPF